jgi:hypothetical protein
LVCIRLPEAWILMTQYRSTYCCWCCLFIMYLLYLQYDKDSNIFCIDASSGSIDYCSGDIEFVSLHR